MVRIMSFDAEVKPLVDMIDSEYAELDETIVAAYNMLGGAYADTCCNAIETRIGILNEMECSISGAWQLGGADGLKLWLHHNHNIIVNHQQYFIVDADEIDTLNWLEGFLDRLIKHSERVVVQSCRM